MQALQVVRIRVITHTRRRTGHLVSHSLVNQPGRTLEGHTRKKAGYRPESIHHIRPGVSLLINDNQSVEFLFSRRLTENKQQTSTKTIKSCIQTMNTQLTVNSHVVKVAHTAPGHSEKKEISPGSAGCNSYKEYKLKYVKGASCVTQLSYVKSVTNVKNAASNLPVGANSAESGCRSKSSSNPERGLHLPLSDLTKLDKISKCYELLCQSTQEPLLLEALHQLINKNAVELVNNQKSLGFFNRLSLVPKPNNKLRPILDLSNLNQFLKVQKFKMETPETIRTSFQQGEWVT